MFTLVLLEIAAIRIVRLPISPFHNNHLSQHFPLLTTMTSQTTIKMASVALDPSTIRQIVEVSNSMVLQNLVRVCVVIQQSLLFPKIINRSL